MAEIKTPTCPRCKQPPTLIISVQQVFCGNEDCDVFCWDMTNTAEEFEALATTVDISTDSTFTE